MIEVDPQAFVADLLNDLRIVGKKPIIRGILIIERRQHQHSAGAGLDRQFGQDYSVSERAAASARHQGMGRNTIFYQALDYADAFLQAK